MGDRRRILALIAIMVAITVVVTGAALTILYNTAFAEERARLTETVQGRARLMEAVARFDQTYSGDYPGGAAAATISQIRAAHEEFKGFGETGEYTVARREGDKIVFVLRHRFREVQTPSPVPFASSLAEPMRRALLGRSGTVVGLDYRGETVLAAHEPVAVLDLGIVAKIDLAEIRAPFIRAGGIVAVLALIAIAAGAALFFGVSNPMIRGIEEREHRYRALSQELDQRVTRRTAELKAANAEMEAFTHSVSHDLRAPLRAIDGFSAALLKEYGERLDGDGRTYLGYLWESSRELEALIDDLLTLFRVTRGEMESEDVDLSRIAADVAEDLEHAEPGRKTPIDIAPGVVVTGDAKLLRVVMENLIGNAWKFTRNEAEARIGFGAERAEGRIHCFVRDNGVGFDMAYADNLFRPFQRLHRTEEFEGTGIGLSTVRRIIARHGGRVWGDGAVGKGATITFELDPGEPSP